MEQLKKPFIRLHYLLWHYNAILVIRFMNVLSSYKMRFGMNMGIYLHLTTNNTHVNQLFSFDHFLLHKFQKVSLNSVSCFCEYNLHVTINHDNCNFMQKYIMYRLKPEKPAKDKLYFLFIYLWIFVVLATYSWYNHVSKYIQVSFNLLFLLFTLTSITKKVQYLTVL